MLRSETISVGGVIAQVASTIGRHWLALYGVALAFVPLNCVQLVTASLPRGASRMAIDGAVIAAQIVGGVIVQGAFTFAIVAALSGGAFALREGFGLTLRRFFPIVGATILLYLVCGSGLLLLVVPAVIAFCVYGQSTVLALVERTGPIASQSRSRQLTRGNRWRIFAVVLVVLLPSFLIFGGLSAYTATAAFKAAAAGRSDLARLAGNTRGLQIATVVFTFILAPLSFSWPAVLYHQLRRAEGVHGPAGVAEVFA